MNKWLHHKLEDLGFIGRGRSRHRPRYAFHLYGGPYPFIQTGDVRSSSKYIDSYSQTYSDEGLKQSKLWDKGTLCITIAANIAEIGILSFDACFPDSVVGFIPDPEKSDLDFIYYSLLYYQNKLKHVGEGSVQDNINLGTFQEITFPIPPLTEQKAIAEVLSSLDDKIDLLHRQNKTLEAMAETLFRQWFVEEAEDDWEDGCLGDLVEFCYGKGLRKSDRTHQGFPVIGSSGIVDYHSEYLIEAPGIVTGRKGTLGVVNYMFYNFYPIDTTFYIRSKLEGSKLYFEYFMLNAVDLVNMNTDSAVPGLNRNLAHSIQVDIPPQKLITDFNAIVEPMFQKIKSNMEQIKTIQDLRDTLLPKLMSGEVRVKH